MTSWKSDNIEPCTHVKKIENLENVLVSVSAKKKRKKERRKEGIGGGGIVFYPFMSDFLKKITQV